jgi:hypothetical protein
VGAGLRRGSPNGFSPGCADAWLGYALWDTDALWDADAIGATGVGVGSERSGFSIATLWQQF